MRPVFAAPETDFVFQRIFGAEVHKRLLIELLRDRGWTRKLRAIADTAARFDSSAAPSISLSPT